ncbi:alpha/beta fold hydrolase [Thalassotalea ponticola]|uniref:alpha/beta fold hydrolase n=1 Tax=Thalassotalea ponticola TaxID=1523392 RepID=UPI0025B4BE23|nr:alpha/beta fold hydrolase [Thalassotalea ponticola]MDN3652243.1 alpha/beta fold hydrolase [Thalassotalea ponticola]
MTSNSILHYQSLNDGVSKDTSPIVLIHGLFGSLENLNMIAKPLSEQHHVISVDVRNHGQSFHRDQMNYQLMADDVIALLASLNINKAHFLGHSMGGKIAMQIALTKPSLVDKLIVADIAPVTYPPHHNAIINGLRAIDLTAIKSRRDADTLLQTAVDEPGVRQFLLKNLAKNDSGFYWRVNIDAIDKNYASIATGFDHGSFDGEVLFIKGANSNYITTEHQPVILQRFPKAKAKIIQGAGHWLHAEKPVAFNKIVQDFIDR